MQYLLPLFNTPKIPFGNNFNTDILRFKEVDNTLYRGGKPSEKQLKDLKKLGIGTIIDFTTGYGLRPEERNEKQLTEGLGMKYINLPFQSVENPSQDYVDTFFNTIENAKKNNEKVFIHCTQGKDRTGLFAAMYELKYGLSNINSAIDEMNAMGHNSKHNPNLIPFLKEFNESLNSDTNLNDMPNSIIGRSMVKNK